MDNDLPKLKISPDQNGYGHLEPASVVFTDTLGGFPKQRVDIPDAPYELSVTWTLNPVRYESLVRFHKKYKTSRFRMDLLINSVVPSEYICQFVPQSFTLSGHSGLTYVMSAGLLALPQIVDPCYDDLMCQLDNCYDLNFSKVVSDVEYLIKLFRALK